MKNRYALALIIALAAAPAAAQPKGPLPDGLGPGPVGGPLGTGPIGPGPLGIGPIGPGPLGIGPIGPGPLGIGPIGPGPQGLGPEHEALIQELKLIEPIVIDKMMIEDMKRLGKEMKLIEPMMIDKVMIEDMKRLGKEMKGFEPAIDKVAIEDAKFKALEAKIHVESMAFNLGQDKRDREAELREREREREAELYSQGFEAAGDYKWDRALAYFNRVIELKSTKLDAALYWKAYSQNRLGQRSEALTTIAELSKNHGSSPYRKQATVLEAEVRRDMGQPVRPQDSTDDEVKLMALQALQNTAPEEAVPMLEKVLEGTNTPRVKQRALYVLAQSRSPRAREVLRNYAKGSSTPELQSQAIRYLGVHGGVENRALLAEVYGSTSDVDVKRMILRSFMTAGDKERVFRAAQTEQNPELRRDAVRYLGNMRATRTGDVLVQIYNGDTNVDVRKAVIHGLFVQENATALVALARKEQDVNLKKELVSRLSNMRSKVATDYMIELLGK